jgi:creatinine amidohydrolase
VTEVRYQMLRPLQIVERRKAFPAVYIPIGTLEWHGVQNPVGADALQSEGIAMKCAQKGGGLVFPTLYYGEPRLEALIDSNPQTVETVSEQMEISPDNWGVEKMPLSPPEQALHYNRLLMQILAQAECLGFEVAVIVVGHYPLIDHARAACLQFNQRRYGNTRRMLAWAFIDFNLVEHLVPGGGDHGGAWETSRVMAFQPQTVDLSVLPPRGEPVVGTMWRPELDPHDADPNSVRDALEAAVDVAIEEVKHRLANRWTYLSHGRSMCEGLWRETANSEQ